MSKLGDAQAEITDKVLYDLVKKKQGEEAADKMFPNGPKAGSGAVTGPISGKTYNYHKGNEFGAAGGIAKEELVALLNKKLNEAGANAKAKKDAQNDNLQGKLAGSDPIKVLALKQLKQQADDREYHQQYYKKNKPDWQPGGKYYYYEPVKKSNDYIGPKQKDELQHGFIGDFFKKHKYFKREENTDGQKQKYRYFYSQDEWNAFKNKVSNTISNVANRLKSAGGATGISEMPSSISKKVSEAKDSIKEKAHKYIEKIEVKPGLFRYFYDQKALDRFKGMLHNWRTDGTFMQKIKKISFADVDGPPTSADNADEVNPGHRSEGKYRSVNCQFCTLATELRNRGYDVTASDISSGIVQKSKILSFFGYVPQYSKSYEVKLKADEETVNKYKGIGGKIRGALKGVMDAGNWYGVQRYSADSTTEVTIKITKADDDATHKSVIPAELDKNFVWNGDNTVNPDKVMNAVLDKAKSYPAGARGGFTIMWNSGGGHSMYWEKDDDGNFIIRDTQGGNSVIVDQGAGNYSDFRAMLSHANPILPIEMERYDDRPIVSQEVLNYVDTEDHKNKPNLIEGIYGVGYKTFEKLSGINSKKK